jgi:hypothetical protein
MSTTPITPSQAVSAVKGDLTTVATQAATAYANTSAEFKADFHKLFADLESVYGVSIAAVKALFPATAPSPTTAPGAAAPAKPVVK